MALKPIHYSALGLGISAIVALVAIWYYRNAATAQAASQTGAQPTPLFQTAAIPSQSADLGGGSAPVSGGATSGATSPTGLSGDQLASISAAQIAANTNTTQASIQANSTNTFTALTTGLFSQILSQLPSVVPGGSNEVNYTIGAPGQALTLYGTSVSNPGGYYVPPTTPTPLVFASPQGTQVPVTPQEAAVSFVPQATQSAPYISPPYMPVAPMNNGTSGSGGE